jgi:hypothetical protein
MSFPFLYVNYLFFSKVSNLNFLKICDTLSLTFLHRYLLAKYYTRQLSVAISNQDRSTHIINKVTWALK